MLILKPVPSYLPPSCLLCQATLVSRYCPIPFQCFTVKLWLSHFPICWGAATGTRPSSWLPHGDWGVFELLSIFTFHQDKVSLDISGLEFSCRDIMGSEISLQMLRAAACQWGLQFKEGVIAKGWVPSPPTCIRLMVSQGLSVSGIISLHRVVCNKEQGQSRDKDSLLASHRAKGTLLCILPTNPFQAAAHCFDHAQVPGKGDGTRWSLWQLFLERKKVEENHTRRVSLYKNSMGEYSMYGEIKRKGIKKNENLQITKQCKNP